MMLGVDKIKGPENLYVAGFGYLNKPDILIDHGITRVLSVVKRVCPEWSEEDLKLLRHECIQVDDDADEDLLVHLPRAVQFIEGGLYPESSSTPAKGGDTAESGSPGAVFVHCMAGRSRSVSVIVAYLLWKHPEQFSGEPFIPSAEATARRRETASDAVASATAWVKQTHKTAQPNEGFAGQLALWWEMGCPVEDDGAVERHPVYQKWLYTEKLKLSLAVNQAPSVEWIRFEDEAKETAKKMQSGADDESKDGRKEWRCKKCRRMLATSDFIVNHVPKTANEAACMHVFVETLSWMRSIFEDEALDGRLVCPNVKCGANIGRFSWQGFRCTCGGWVCPALSLNKSRIDEVSIRPPGSGGVAGIRMPPGRIGNL